MTKTIWELPSRLGGGLSVRIAVRDNVAGKYYLVENALLRIHGVFRHLQSGILV